MRRLPFESAVVRSSKLGCASDPSGAGSMSATRRPSGARATARLAPIIPPPAMTTSTENGDGSIFVAVFNCVSLAWKIDPSPFSLHRAFNGVGLGGQSCRQHLGRAARHGDVVLDAHADVPPLARDLRH